MNPKVGYFLKAKDTIKVTTINSNTKEINGMLELNKNELCEIKNVHLQPTYALEVDCRGKLLSFSLIDIEEQQFSFYQNIFVNYTLNKKDIRKEKLQRIDSLRNE
jgi:hypothetical protein